MTAPASAFGGIGSFLIMADTVLGLLLDHLDRTLQGAMLICRLPFPKDEEKGGKAIPTRIGAFPNLPTTSIARRALLDGLASDFGRTNVLTDPSADELFTMIKSLG